MNNYLKNNGSEVEWINSTKFKNFVQNVELNLKSLNTKNILIYLNVG